MAMAMAMARTEKAKVKVKSKRGRPRRGLLTLMSAFFLVNNARDEQEKTRFRQALGLTPREFEVLSRRVKVERFGQPALAREFPLWVRLRSLGEIAEELGISQARAHAAYYGGLRKIKRYIEDLVSLVNASEIEIETTTLESARLG